MSVIHKFGFGFAAVLILFLFAAGQLSLAILSREHVQPSVSPSVPSLHEKMSESFVLGPSGITVQTGPLENFQD
jgi:hypothetical protein